MMEPMSTNEKKSFSDAVIALRDRAVRELGAHTGADVERRLEMIWCDLNPGRIVPAVARRAPATE